MPCPSRPPSDTTGVPLRLDRRDDGVPVTIRFDDDPRIGADEMSDPTIEYWLWDGKTYQPADDDFGATEAVTEGRRVQWRFRQPNSGQGPHPDSVYVVVVSVSAGDVGPIHSEHRLVLDGVT